MVERPNSTLVKTITDKNDRLCSYDSLTENQRRTANVIIDQFKEISYETRGLGRTSLITHTIDTGDAAPIRQRYYRMSPEKQRILSRQLDEMLQDDVVEPCESPWSSPVLLTPKKNGELRFCLDSRKLNAVTKKDAYSLPYISDILDNLRDAKYLSSLDLSKSFWQILIKKEDRCKTAFYIPSRGTFQFKSMPFGLTNAPATQQRLVDTLFYGPEFEHMVFVFVDDIIVISPTFEEHIALLKRVLNKLKIANLTINFEKSKFFRNKLNYLGYVVDCKGLHADPTKIEAILNYKTPGNRKEVRRFLGTASWYRRFIPNFSALASPLNKLTSQKKNAPSFCWTPEAESSFKKLKECLVTAPVLSCPDYSKPFEVHADASDFGLGAVLTQTLDGNEKVIAYMSKSLNDQERNYSATEREALAVLTAIEHWRCYLENGHKFIVYTDHASLKWFLNLNNPTGRLARWGVRLSAYNFEIKHRKGSENVVPDSLSRSVPIAVINESSSKNVPPNTSDPWYLNIYNGTLNSP
ncbi:jg24696, partial [Pararge aegeria aegeria]